MKGSSMKLLKNCLEILKKNNILKGVYNVDALLLYSFSALNRRGGEDIIKMLPKKQRELFKKTRAEHKKIKLLNATYKNRYSPTFG